ncbi:hypothetical protein E2C01_052858 [Portunus trituberculatus]|uniref:Uncharacterized protein n=1 Tax=Portunus trituberculatus TaxID=210409 RepID=A0A5B7GPB4_PORTR|nr:hypothetical protein [Portunus trituberculatus]
MNLATLRENPHARKRRRRVATRKDGASLENCGRGDSEVVKGETATWEEPRDCTQAGPAKEETSLPEAKEKQLVSFAQPATRKPSLKYGRSERTVENPDRPTKNKTHPVSRLPNPEEEIYTGADDESVPWQTDIPEETPPSGTFLQLLGCMVHSRLSTSAFTLQRPGMKSGHREMERLLHHWRIVAAKADRGSERVPPDFLR